MFLYVVSHISSPKLIPLLPSFFYFCIIRELHISPSVRQNTPLHIPTILLGPLEWENGIFVAYCITSPSRQDYLIPWLSTLSDLELRKLEAFDNPKFPLLIAPKEIRAELLRCEQ